MKFQLLALMFAFLVSCGYADQKLGGKDGSDGSSGAPGEAGKPGEDGKNGADAVVGSLACSVDLHYPGDPNTYTMKYLEVVLASGETVASLRYYNAKSTAVVFQESAVFESGEEIHLESPSWRVKAGVLTHKPSATTYTLKCD